MSDQPAENAEHADNFDLTALSAFRPGEHLSALELPAMSDYFGVWAVHPDSFLPTVQKCQGINLHAHLQSAEVKQQVARSDKRAYQISVDGVAMFHMSGVLMKHVPSMTAGTSYVNLRRQLNQARRDPEVKAGILIGDTNGGAASGNPDAVAAVAKFAEVKPIVGFVDDRTMSAGVSIMSQTTERYANTGTAAYGAMGTYTVLTDQSQRAEKLGIQVHVIAAGEFKGMGEPGTEIDEKQLAEVQRVVNRINEAYLQTIATGTKLPMEIIRSLADGRVIFADDAVAAGLLQGVKSFNFAFARAVELGKNQAARSGVTYSTPRRQESKPMSETKQEGAEPRAATLQELRTKFPASSAEWREQQVMAGVTLEAAAIDFANAQAEANKKLAAELEEAKSKQATPAAPGADGLGFQPLTAATARDADELQATGDPAEDFDLAVRNLMSRGLDRRAAVQSVKRNSPQLFKSYLLATNGSAKHRRQIEERFEELEGAKA